MIARDEEHAVEERMSGRTRTSNFGKLKNIMPKRLRD